MDPTTVPRPTKTPPEYAADAIADHLRRHGPDRVATAALELAVVLADSVDPAQLNTIADRLDLLSFPGTASAGVARGRVDPFAVALHTVIDDDDGTAGGDRPVVDLMQALADSVDEARAARRARHDADGYPPAHEYDGPHYDTPAPQS